ncbi:RES family NAD+ phosphorylase [Hydrogenophaga sp. BPS33]|uniref:RES family NAD+ phosphorylase n=1 Tax=Hydrogenophaga sp. BPS33 TaxID=2651974 RepID=UPI00131FE546|nr:RES family NAD+ phosphorylase [Hydrogenophaga sp. BPS33]QHE87142.1 RES family NAD+ phosphorylase [Hydrogenophaga sp. BPS33]
MELNFVQRQGTYPMNPGHLLNMPETLVDPIICEHCLVNNELKWELQERGTAIEECPICHRSGGRSLSATDPKVKRIFRALIRLNFSEWDYNTHLGGEPLQGLVMESQVIFNLGQDASADAFEDAYLQMEASWYPDEDEGISLGGGYWDGGILDGLRDRRDSSVEGVIQAALEKNWFETEAAAAELVEKLRDDITTVIPAGEQFFRGRIGVRSRLSPRLAMPTEGRNFRYVPYTGTDIDRPPLKLATEGRFNRARVSLLYLASDAETAVAELRPHPGHLVSTAMFRLKRDITIANFAIQDIRNYLSDSRLEQLRRILSIADVLDVPVQPEHRVLYAVTQLLADSLRTAGFEGVTFNSSVGQGINLTSFVGDAFELVLGSEDVQDVLALSYRMKPSQAIRPDYDSEDWKEDDDSPLATLLHGMARRRK